VTNRGRQSPRVPRELRRQLEIGGLPWAVLARRAQEIVLFGSRSQGVAGPDSDWDLLCVGEGSTSRVGSVHLVWVPSTEMFTRKWLGSELAGHIAAYGVWLVGTSHWQNQVFVSATALAHKQRIVKARLAALDRYQHDLAPARRAYYGLRIRRDVQRLMILRAGRPVPASPLLDRAWTTSISRERWMEICHSLDLDNDVADKTWRIVSSNRQPAKALSTKPRSRAR
jgi:nucleotidyltransferase-like protein